MKVLFILNDPPYGTERVYNALRLQRRRPTKSWFFKEAASGVMAGEEKLLAGNAP